MRQIELWLDEDAVIEDAEGNCYTGITHIDSRAGADGYVETFDDEVINFSEMDEHMLADVAQLIEDYAPDGAAMGGVNSDAPLLPKHAKAIGWVRDDKGNVTNYTVKDTFNCITQFSGGGGFKDPETGMANTSPYVLLEY